MCYRCSVGDFVKTGYNHLKITRELLLTLSQNTKGYLTQYCLHIVYHLINNTKNYLTQYCLHIVYPQTTTLNTLVTNNKLLNVNQ
jgi:hypothetical protein